MEKVKCLKCGSEGYTAAPSSVTCDKCDSDRLEVICMAEDNNGGMGKLSQYLRTLVRFNKYPVICRSKGA